MQNRATLDLDELLVDVRQMLSNEEAASQADSIREQEPFDWAAQNFTGEDVGPYEVTRRRKRQKKKRNRLLRFVGVLLVLLIILMAGTALFVRQPVAGTGGLGERRPGVSTILLAGTDADGMRTDTLMLLSMDMGSGKLSLVSIPRDTLVNGGYPVPKINAAYGWVGKGERGMEELMTRVSEIIGFSPDGYALVELPGFVDLVDCMGGVEFDVPIAMQYRDPAQNLVIDLAPGVQKLDGEQAMGLVRFRSGYALADLQRVSVQREFVSAAADQWATVESVTKIPQLLKWYKEYVTTDLTVRNFAWLGLGLLRADLSVVSMETMPGSGRTISGGSYYCLEPGDTAEMVNRLLNPYRRNVAAGDLKIRVG